MTNLLNEAAEFVALRAKLVSLFALQHVYPESFERSAFLPKSGHVHLEGDTWTWQRHGLGLRFTSPEGVVVERFRADEPKDLFEIFELEEYQESLGRKGDLEPKLKDLAERGLLERVGNYRFVLLSDKAAPIKSKPPSCI
ncbi:MAG: hypothetical protein AAGD04_01600 [Pseudomonadota bacterium]